VLASAAFFLEPIGSEAKRLSDRTNTLQQQSEEAPFSAAECCSLVSIVSIENKMSGKWFQ
jgi:hypothetical protein